MNSNHEMPPGHENTKTIIDGLKTREADLAIVGYAHACIGLAMSLIKKAQNTDRHMLDGGCYILSEGDGYTFWSATGMKEGSDSGSRAITFAYQLDDDKSLGVQTLSKVWIAETSIDKRSACLLIVRDTEGVPRSCRYTNRKGWHASSRAHIKNIFYRDMLIMDKSESIRPRRDLLEEHGRSYFMKTMQEFEHY